MEFRLKFWGGGGGNYACMLDQRRKDHKKFGNYRSNVLLHIAHMIDLL